MDRISYHITKCVLILKLLAWAVFGLALFAVRYVKSRFVKDIPAPQPPLALKILVQGTTSRSDPLRELDPYRSNDGDSANIRALRYL